MPRLLLSPLVAPYVLRAYVTGVRLTTLTAPEDHEWPAPIVGWWSLRVLRPARLLRHQDVAQLQGHLATAAFAEEQMQIARNAIADADKLIYCWSAQAIGDQTAKVLDFLSRVVSSLSQGHVVYCAEKCRILLMAKKYVASDWSFHVNMFDFST